MIKYKCKACLNKVLKIDERSLCSHCAFRIDTADAIASDINGIREDMFALGIPTSGFKSYGQGSYEFDFDGEENE